MWQKTPPKCIVLRSPEGDDLGFMLTALDDGALTGSCVFLILPRNPALLKSPAGLALLARKAAGESTVDVVPGASLAIRLTSPGLPALRVELNDAGAGSWREEPPGQASGLAAAAAAT